MYIKLTILILFLLLCKFSIAQIFYPIGRKKYCVSLSASYFKKSPSILLGFSKGVHLKVGKLINEDIAFFIELTDKMSNVSDNTFKFTSGGIGNIYKSKIFAIPFRKTFDFERVKIHNDYLTFLGTSFEIYPGWYYDKKFFAFDIYYGDYIKGRVYSKGNFANDILEGWLIPHYGDLRTGIVVGKKYKYFEVISRLNFQFYNGHQNSNLVFNHNLKGLNFSIGINKFF